MADPPAAFWALLVVFVAVFGDGLRLVSAAPESALVTQLPGFNGTFLSKHYAGYVTIDKVRGKHLYYYFVLSERNPSEDPLVLWLNGGPGCSSFDGFIYEHGPFNFESGNGPGNLPRLHLNPYSWSKVSSVIYLDSPVGVGLSYSANKSDYITGDLKTAADSHTFLLKWFEQYAEFLGNPFYIAGESYAGVYVPTLAFEIVKGIQAGLKNTLNFKGYLVGNGVTDTVFDGDALVPFAHGMGLISDNLFEEVYSSCKGSYWNPDNDGCKNSLDKIDKALEKLNIYDTLEPCYHSQEIRQIVSNVRRLPVSFRSLGQTEKPFPVRKRMFGRSWPLRAPVRDGLVPTWPELGQGEVPCTNDELAYVWMNNDLVRRAIHAELENVAGVWNLCTDNIKYYHDAGSMIKYHRNLTLRGYRALIFSGDHDMCVPFTGSEAWTRSMRYKVTEEWRPWFFDEQVSGYSRWLTLGIVLYIIPRKMINFSIPSVEC